LRPGKKGKFPRGTPGRGKNGQKKSCTKNQGGGRGEQLDNTPGSRTKKNGKKMIWGGGGKNITWNNSETGKSSELHSGGGS